MYMRIKVGFCYYEALNMWLFLSGFVIKGFAKLKKLIIIVNAFQPGSHTIQVSKVSIWDVVKIIA